MSVVKTLARISKRLVVHSHPYSFAAHGLALSSVDSELAIGRFYKPASDTLIVLDLTDQFQEETLKDWFESWEEDRLLFLNKVSSFRMYQLILFDAWPIKETWSKPHPARRVSYERESETVGTRPGV